MILPKGLNFFILIITKFANFFQWWNLKEKKVNSELQKKINNWNHDFNLAEQKLEKFGKNTPSQVQIICCWIWCRHIRHNDTQHNDNKRNEIQHNDIPYNEWHSV